MALTNVRAGTSGLDATTIDHWMISNGMNLFVKNDPFFRWLLDNGRIQKNTQGQFIRVPLLVPDTNTPQLVGVSNAWTDMEATPTGGLETANYRLAHLHKNIGFDEYELSLNRGAAAKVNQREAILTKNYQDALNTLRQNHLWAAETGTKTGGTDRDQVGSLRTYINSGVNGTTTDAGLGIAHTLQTSTAITSTTGSTANYTVAGINRNAAGAAHWCACVDTTDATLSVRTLSKMITATHFGGHTCDMIIMPGDVFDVLMGLSTFSGTSGGQFFQQSKLASIGYTALNFRGAEIIVDDNCPVGGDNSGHGYVSGTATALGYQVFFLNTEYLSLEMNSRRPKTTEYSDGRPLEQYRWDWYMQLVSTNLGRVHGRATYALPA